MRHPDHDIFLEATNHLWDGIGNYSYKYHAVYMCNIFIWYLFRNDLRSILREYFDPNNRHTYWFDDLQQSPEQDQADRFVALCLMNEIYNDLLEEK